MLQAMFAGVSGMQTHQIKMGVIGNNIANVNTNGFKAGRATFQDQLSQTLRAASRPNSAVGGQNPVQVGLGVTLGAIDTLQTQGNLQTTGKITDLAIQGGGFFVVSDGRMIQYSRDGSFDIDSTGSLVSTSTGQRLLGYQADEFGNIDTSIPITAGGSLKIPIGQLTEAKQTGNITFSGNLDAGSAVQTTRADFTGNLDSAATSGSVTNTVTVYDSLGNPHTVQTIFANPVDNPTGTGVPTGATRAWDVTIKVDNITVYDSAAGKSRIYQVGGAWQFADTTTGALLGSTIQMDGAAGSNHGPQIPGANGAPAFSVDLNYGALTSNAAASAISGSADGQTGSAPFWGASIQVYDSLGIAHLISFKYTRVPIEAGAPTGATSRWEWTAIENGSVVGSSSDAGNTPIYFGNTGQLIAGARQSVTITPTNGAVSPFTIEVDNLKLTQRAADFSAVAESQNGYPAGALNSFSISPDGVITGIYSSGLTRVLGQIAMASFANPSGLEKVGNNTFRQTSNSGNVQIGVPNQAGRGKLSPGFLEMSNVDLSTEFTNLIITERGFQANTRIISVVDSLLQDVINLKR